MKRTLYAILAVIGIMLVLAGSSDKKRHMTLKEGDKLIVTDFEYKKRWYYYEFRTLKGETFTIATVKGMGYDKGDTIKFFGYIPTCKEKNGKLHYAGI